MTPVPLAGSCAVIFAAGLGTRMRSDRAKALHPLGGLPLVTWAVRAARPLVERVVVVVGHGGDRVRGALSNEGVVFADQDEQLGTGHALSCAREAIEDAKELLVLACDVPRLRSATLAALLAEHVQAGAGATVLTFTAEDPTGYGRIVRGSDERVRAIVEHAQADDEVRRVREVNSSIYAFDARVVMPLLDRLPQHGRERYLTDVLELMTGHAIAAYEAPESEVMGINTQEQLARAEALYRQERAHALMASGVTLVDPGAVTVEADVTVGPGTVLSPFVSLEGRTRVGPRCTIGSFVRLKDTRVGAGAMVTGPISLEDADIGPSDRRSAPQG